MRYGTAPTTFILPCDEKGKKSDPASDEHGIRKSLCSAVLVYERDAKRDGHGNTQEQDQDPNKSKHTLGVH
jgi:hypothetical protein